MRFVFGALPQLLFREKLPQAFRSPVLFALCSLAACARQNLISTGKNSQSLAYGNSEPRGEARFLRQPPRPRSILARKLLRGPSAQHSETTFSPKTRALSLSTNLVVTSVSLSCQHSTKVGRDNQDRQKRGNTRRSTAVQPW